MGKIFDNSGKNTENEIYDTSHRQYWAPPGAVAWKDNLLGFFGILLSILLVMLFDCFILHPIPAPEGTFDIHTEFAPRFSLEESGCEYADAKILSSYTVYGDRELYLVEQDGQVHLLMLKESILFTWKIAEDVIIREAETQTIKLGLSTVTIEGGRRISDVSSVSASNYRLTLGIYAIIGVAIAVTGSFIWQKVKKLFK